MQLGFTMFEKMIIDGGQVTNASLADYKIPGLHDVPAVMVNEAVEAYQATGRSAPRASARSRRSACRRRSPTRSRMPCGVRLTELPLNPEAVFRALRAKDGSPLEDA